MTKITRDMWEPRKRDPRKLSLKIRLVYPRHTPFAVLRAAVEQSIREQRVVPPIKAIHWVDWKKGEEGHANAGRYTPPEMWDALKDFYAAITHPNTRLRVGIVDDTAE